MSMLLQSTVLIITLVKWLYLEESIIFNNVQGKYIFILIIIKKLRTSISNRNSNKV